MSLLTSCRGPPKHGTSWCVFLALVAVLSPTFSQRPPPSRYSLYSVRTSRASDDDSYEYVRFHRPPLYGNANVRIPSNSASSSVVVSKPARSYVTSSNSGMVIRHPNSCSYNRSQAACTFSLLCYLANGVPVEGCEGNPTITCCYMNSKMPNSASINKEQVPVITNSHNHFPSSSIDYSSSSQVSNAPSAVSLGSSTTYFTQKSPSNAISSFYNQNPKYRTVPFQTSEAIPSSTKLNVEHNYNEYRHKQDLLAPFESKPQGLNKLETDYLSNTIRRTRTDNVKSIFQEIANRKLYARNYDIEDICGKPTAKPRSRIIGGQDAYFGEFPWQVHIKITKHQCGGALIDSKFIVTAAHCIYQAPMRQLNVIIGAHDIEDPRFQDIPPQYFSVTKVLLHPNFRFSASHPDRYDIALIKLDKAVRFSDSVLPVCLPEENFQFEGWHGVVTGWGKTDPALSNRYGTRLLQKVDVPVIDNDKCETWHRTRGIDLHIFNEMMCAGYEDGQKDACVGDSGGPLVVNVNGRWTLGGITSAGFGCAQSRQPGIYHRVSQTVDWIKSTVRSEKEDDVG